MRRMLLLAALLAACRAAPPAATASGPATLAGDDLLLMRLPRGGGAARVIAWNSDSVLWTGKTGPVDHTLAFDMAQGTLAMVGPTGIPGRLDLRPATAPVTPPPPLLRAASVDGTAIFGLNPAGQVTRLTPTGQWVLPLTDSVRALIPQPDGSLLMLSDHVDRSVFRRVHPPDTRILDSAVVPRVDTLYATVLGDRVYWTRGRRLGGFRVRGLAPVPAIELPDPPTDVAITPSGDRLYVALAKRRKLAVVDRYEGALVRAVELPDVPRQLRMDPDGRYLLARSAKGDSVHVVSIGTERVVSSVRSVWRQDLPVVASDGGVVTVADADVAITDAETRRERRRFAGGAADVWALVHWNGFRPRAAGLDIPVRFAREDTLTAADSAAADSVPPDPPMEHRP